MYTACVRNHLMIAYINRVHFLIPGDLVAVRGVADAAQRPRRAVSGAGAAGGAAHKTGEWLRAAGCLKGCIVTAGFVQEDRGNNG